MKQRTVLFPQARSFADALRGGGYHRALFDGVGLDRHQQTGGE